MVGNLIADRYITYASNLTYLCIFCWPRLTPTRVLSHRAHRTTSPRTAWRDVRRWTYPSSTIHCNRYQSVQLECRMDAGCQRRDLKIFRATHQSTARWILYEYNNNNNRFRNRKILILHFIILLYYRNLYF